MCQIILYAFCSVAVTSTSLSYFKYSTIWKEFNFKFYLSKNCSVVLRHLSDDGIKKYTATSDIKKIVSHKQHALPKSVVDKKPFNMEVMWNRTNLSHYLIFSSVLNGTNNLSPRIGSTHQTLKAHRQGIFKPRCGKVFSCPTLQQHQEACKKMH